MTQRERIERYIAEAYGIEGDHPFEGDGVTTVFRHPQNNKWFALMMEIPLSRLGHEDDSPAWVMNLKCDFILISSLLKEKGFYPAYHMNKTHWITVRLDCGLSDERISDLLDISYDLTNIKRKKR